MKPLNPYILQAFARLPTGLGYRFTPTSRLPTDPRNPRDPLYDGVLNDVVVEGRVVARSAADHATYCCGVTFEVWWRALLDAGCEVPSDAATASALVEEWFCPTMGHAGVVEALVRRGWGARVSVEDAIPGDLVQYWRRVDLARPSGHSAIVLQVDGDVLRYASSQPATSGVGIHEERMEPSWQVHVVRPWLTTS